ncbi:hypothetical protein [Defluviimonas salinarum]|uniref:Uncharacterized protein n=1 Tax=Defluviimonas salinarum TaxID=2992147 RepID=A0ABT3J5I9_9RHOB|nr:hypothetical protein [Defluviimonas salinarum]MCW3782961.1 hypothetical protein [Defluviimonas salinarum]
MKRYAKNITCSCDTLRPLIDIAGNLVRIYVWMIILAAIITLVRAGRPEAWIFVKLGLALIAAQLAVTWAQGRRDMGDADPYRIRRLARANRFAARRAH